MTGRSVEHATFTIERRYDAPPARVFAAWADRDSKRRWFVDHDGGDWETLSYDMEFRVGGREHGRFRFQGAAVHGSETVYLDIVPDRRIVFVYVMSIDDARSSASLATVELTSRPGGTTLVFTEQVSFLDGRDSAKSRKGGWDWLLDHLGNEISTGAMS